MIIFIISTVVMMAGITVYFVSRKYSSYASHSDSITFACMIFTCLVELAVVGMIFMALICNSAKRASTEQKREDIVERLNSDDTNVGTEMIEFNEELTKEQYWSKSWWTNWFNSQCVNEFKVIKYNEYTGEYY